MKLLLDTHAWIWWHAAPQKLSEKTRKLISYAKDYEEILLSAISIWEFAKLLERGRVSLSIAGDQWIEEALRMAKFRVVPLSPEIAWQSCNLPKPFHDDPADQIIVATARTENAVIITKDKLISKYPHIKCTW